MRKQCKRQVRAIVNPLTAMRPAPKQKTERVMVRFLTALDAMANGQHPGLEEWRDLSDVVNTIETLALHMGKLIPSEVMPAVTAATEAMAKAGARYREGKTMRLDGPGLQALRDLVHAYGVCLEGLTEMEMAQAQAETQRRVNAILRAKPSQSHTVVML